MRIKVSSLCLLVLIGVSALLAGCGNDGTGTTYQECMDLADTAKRDCDSLAEARFGREMTYCQNPRRYPTREAVLECETDARETRDADLADCLTDYDNRVARCNEKYE